MLTPVEALLVSLRARKKQADLYSMNSDMCVERDLLYAQIMALEAIEEEA